MQKYAFLGFASCFSILLVNLTVPRVNAQGACSIQKSIYRDADNRGFELVLSEAIPAVGSLRATAKINHSQQDNLYQFDVVQANGYGSFFAMNHADEFVINFFDANLGAANISYIGSDVEAPNAVFISGLGSHDYYNRKDQVSEKTAPLLGDTMWIYDRCQ
ncbi:hypothetical protein [Lyngbya aestuarii]|uniref:hypothetical protein n=1 Tax=Lyngbya aestuarii TaxID=118322 RepID=UPI00403DDEC6